MGFPEELLAKAELLLVELEADRATLGAEGEYLFQRTRLMRFVLANEGSVEDAAAQFRRMLQWRREANIAQIRANVKGRPWAAESVPGLDRLLGFMVMDLWGTTPTGDLLMVQCDGLTQFSGMSEVTDEELNESLYSMLELRQEHLDRMSEEQGRLVMVVQVRDLSGMAIMSLLSNARLIGQLQSVIKNGMDAYPECSKNTVLLNAPSSFEALMALVRPITSARAQAKLKSVGLGQMEEMLALGGPESLRVLGRLRSDAGAAVSSAEVAAGSSAAGVLRVGAGEDVGWSFAVDAGSADIGLATPTLGFSVRFFPDAADSPAVEAKAYEDVSGKVSGEFLAREPGTLWAVWSNEQSWIQGVLLEELCGFERLW